MSRGWMGLSLGVTLVAGPWAGVEAQRGAPSPPSAGPAVPLRAAGSVPARVVGPRDPAVADSVAALGERLRQTPKQKGIERGAIAQGAADVAPRARAPRAEDPVPARRDAARGVNAPPPPPVRPQPKSAAVRESPPA
jgi:hypothetical protein